MNIPLSWTRTLAFFAVFSLAWMTATVARPTEDLTAPSKTVLVLYGERLSIPAMAMTEQGLNAGLARAHPLDGCDRAEGSAGRAPGERESFSHHGRYRAGDDLDVGSKPALHLFQQRLAQLYRAFLRAGAWQRV